MSCWKWHPLAPLDDNDNRFFCDGTSPQDQFNLNNVVYNLDGMVEDTGVANTSSSHPALSPRTATQRLGANNPGMSGPLGRDLIELLAHPANGLILDSWIDADGVPQGNADDFVNN